MRLTSLIALILGGNKVEEYLPDGKVITFDFEEDNNEYKLGSFLEEEFDNATLKKLLYLQTLSMNMRKVGGYPRFAELLVGPETNRAVFERKHVTERDMMVWKEEAMMVELPKRSNLWDKIGLLEDLIVELIEESAPSEVNHHGVRYRVTEGQVRRVSISEPKYLKGVIIPA